MTHTLRFDPQEIRALANEYVQKNADQDNEEKIIDEISPRIRKNGYYGRDDFLKLCYWKSPRPRKWYESNEDAWVKEITGIALTSQSERLRIEVLPLLKGVSWSTASVLLHFGHKDQYPILDFRALWSLSIEEPNAYDFSFWSEYVGICRGIANKFDVDMRVLDRALWQYSSVKQPRSAEASSCMNHAISPATHS